MNIQEEFNFRIDNDKGYDNEKLAKDLIDIANKHLPKQCAISCVVARLSSTYGQIYVHKERNPDRVYLSSESPQLKLWCKIQSEKLRKRDF